jgi:hypothetical protein
LSCFCWQIPKSFAAVRQSIIQLTGVASVGKFQIFRCAAEQSAVTVLFVRDSTFFLLNTAQGCGGGGLVFSDALKALPWETTKFMSWEHEVRAKEKLQLFGGAMKEQGTKEKNWRVGNN